MDGVPSGGRSPGGLQATPVPARAPGIGAWWAGSALAWLLGVGWQLQQAQVWAPGLRGAAGAVALLVMAGMLASASSVRPWTRPDRSGQAGQAAPVLQRPPRLAWPVAAAWLRWGLCLLATAMLAAALTHQRAAWRLADALPAALEGVDLLATGTVAELPQTGPQGTRFVFEIESAVRAAAAAPVLAPAPLAVPRRVSLGWYRAAEPGALLRGPDVELRAGQRWQLTLRLQRPHALMNPHGFDLELWLFERGIRASGSVRATPGAVNVLLEEAAAHPLQRLRQHLRDALYRHVDDAGTAGVLVALVLGDQASILREDWALFRDTGVAHLMAISGLHVTMFAWAAAAVVGRLWRLSPRALLALPAPVAARWGGLALAVAYALLAGWGVPAQRTVVMLAVVVMLRSGAMRWPAPGVLLAAALAVSLGDPWALLQPGFWLSFVAVGLLMLSDPAAPSAAARPGQGWLGRSWTWLRGSALTGLRTQAVATLGLAPLSLLFFQQISLVGFAANLVAIPLVTLLITPLALLGVLLPALWALPAALLQGLMALLQPMAALPWAVWVVPVAPGWAQAAGLAGGLLAVAPLPWRLRACGVLLLLPLLLPPVPRPAPGTFDVVVPDIGQGSAVLVRTRHHLLVYDTGPVYGTAHAGDKAATRDAGERVLLPLLRALGESRIDLLMLSHRDTDHIGGASSLLAAMPVRAVAGSLPAGHPLFRGPSAWRCQAGQRWVWDGVSFEVLHPAADAPPGERPNAQSCVLRIQAQADPLPARSLLLAGDIEAEQEATLVRQQGAALASQVLLVPHHGSRTSSTAAFVAAVAPQVAVVQAGHRSRFGHPAAEVLAQYAAHGVPVVRSSRCGAWTLPARGEAACVRQARARYWHHPDGLPGVAD